MQSRKDWNRMSYIATMGGMGTGTRNWDGGTKKMGQARTYPASVMVRKTGHANSLAGTVMVGATRHHDR